MASESNRPGKARYVVASAADLPPGSRKIVTVGGREIGVFNIEGNFFALRNVCPHKGAPLCHGRLRPLIVSTGMNEIEYQREGEILKCPWHLWEFDIKTGQALYDEAMRVRTYAVFQEGEEIALYLDVAPDSS
jgi:3-phenylpropionate/trans-cinnamate dioxygenase ferredoxin subunit